MWSGQLGAVTASTGLTLNVGTIYAGEYVINGSTISTLYTGSTVSVTAAHASLPRRDIVTIDTSGAVAVTAGTAATNPAPPAIGTSKIPLAEIAVAANTTQITSANIYDKRQLMSQPRVIRKGSDETVNTSASLQDDNDFIFFADPTARYLVRLYLKTSIPTAPGIIFNWFQKELDQGTSFVAAPLAIGYVGGGTSQYTLAAETTVGGVPVLSIATPGFTIAGLIYTALLTPSGTGASNGVRMQFRWAQQASTASDTTLSAGSFCIIERMAV